MSMTHVVGYKPTHSWLRKINVAFVPGPGSDDLEEVTGELLDHFKQQGHNVQDGPTDDTDVLLTTALFGDSMNWRDAVIFKARRQFQLNRTPTVYTVVRISRAEFDNMLNRFAEVLKKDSPDPSDYDFPDLSPQAYRVLYEQGRRGGPMLVLERLMQAYSKSLHILLVVGGPQPETVYHFDLVGAFPETRWEGADAFYDDIVTRITTTMSTREVTKHQVVGDIITHELWNKLTTPGAMNNAGKELGKRSFFTDMVRISDIVSVPAITESVANQYSEGCFSTWDPAIGALIATITGSARPVYKGNITDDDLAVIVGVREGGIGATVREVEGKRNDPPSSEAVEMMDMDALLPRIELGPEWETRTTVPVVRSKLHGHRGIVAFNPEFVEHTPLDPPFYYYPVSCATEAQARGIKDAFSRSQALQNPDDPRQIAFTVLPGHGVVMAEKWVPGKVPFEIMWEYMDKGWLQVASAVPQSTVDYEIGADGLAHLK